MNDDSNYDVREGYSADASQVVLDAMFPLWYIEAARWAKVGAIRAEFTSASKYNSSCGNWKCDSDEIR